MTKKIEVGKDYYANLKNQRASETPTTVIRPVDAQPQVADIKTVDTKASESTKKTAPKTNLDADFVKRLYEGKDAELAASSSGKNSTTPSTSTAVVVKGQDPKNAENPDGFLKGWKPEPNIMSELFQPTYHFSFYLDSDITSEADTQNEFVIAETGLTGMNIQEVNIDTMVGPNVRTRNAITTNIEIKIYEPLGAMLPDLLFQAAVKKQIYNYLKAPWYLKLKLHGYDHVGNVVPVGDGWTWKLSLIDIQTKISEDGSYHTITALPLAEVALNNQYCMLPDGKSLDGTTVGEVMKKLAETMNDGVKTKYGNTHPPFIEYVIDDREYPYDTKVGVTKPFDHKITSSVETTSNLSNVTTYGVQTSQYGAGSDIPGLLDSLMARCETAVKMARLSRELPPSSGIDDETTIRDAASILHRIETKVEYVGYDVIMGDYCKKITYTVKPYSSLRLLTSIGRAMNFDKEKDLTKKKAVHAIERSFLHKQYDYVFTGLNTEVEKFDIQTNFRWAVSVPLLQGWAVNQTNTAKVDPTAQAKAHTDQLGYHNSTLAETDAKIAEADKEIKAEGFDPNSEQGKATQARRAQLQAARDKHYNAVQRLSNAVGAERDKINKVNRDKVDAARKALPAGRTIDGEDLVYENARDGGDGYAGAGRGGNSFLPITINQDADRPASEAGYGSSNDPNSNKSVYGALLNQLYGSFDGNLQNLELDIKGDPYWLGPGSNGEIYDTPSTGVTPNFTNGEHIFVFRFKLPIGYDQRTGTVALSQGANEGNNNPGGSSNIFTGFYATSQVVHHFRDGAFTQTLTGTRIQGWDYDHILNGKENIGDDLNYSDTQSPASQTQSGGSGNQGSTTAIPSNIDERTLLALTLYGEARSEGARGMQAVGNVITNRIRDPRYPNNVSSVIMQRRQFSVWTTDDVTRREGGTTPAALKASIKTPGDKQSFDTAYKIAGDILAGKSPDITGGATSYYNPKTSSPNWGSKATTTAVIGRHRFVKV
jgi:spore germination cell wall hydrolase CwlJ-like protein